ncbi:MAG: nuclear transport factor 2 family protein [Gammaproteobacteria bacterium]|nr:nuclear transport factor 2 family protein [Gammaproteobacteria bacterium]
MTEEHPNIAVLKRFNPTNVAETIDVFAEDVIWHYYNARLPDLHGDYVGHAGIQTFFEKLRLLAGSDFKINTVAVTAVGDELVVVHRKQVMNLENHHIESDVVVVWRIVDGRIAEVWDIPSVHS